MYLEGYWRKRQNENNYCNSYFGGFLFGSNENESIGQKKKEIKPNIFKIEELNAFQIDALDRDKTLLFLPIGTLEQHSSHLPIGTDSFVANLNFHLMA